MLLKPSRELRIGPCSRVDLDQGTYPSTGGNQVDSYKGADEAAQPVGLGEAMVSTDAPHMRSQAVYSQQHVKRI
jgi:hypothetical protein